MNRRARSIWALLVCLLPLVLWFAYFNAIYSGQTLACLLPEAPHRGFAYLVGAVTALLLGGSAAALLRETVRIERTRPVGLFDLTLLAAIGTFLIAAAALALPLC
jgi:hypothetical protein